MAESRNDETTSIEHKNGSIQRSGRRRRTPRVYYVLPLLMIACSLFYYFGELIDIAGLQALHWKFFDSVHDIHRMFFLAPVVYAGYVARVKGAVIITLVSFMIFIPRALLISPFPDPILRAVLFTIIAGVIGVLTGVIRNEAQKSGKIESILTGERGRFQEILEKLDEGVIITGPDYKIRYINPSMEKKFGTGTGSYCYRYLLDSDTPCGSECKMPAVLTGKVDKWQYRFPDGRVYEIIASPYTDSDGTVCQLAIFRDITGQNES